MTIETLAFLVLLVLILGTLPVWPHAQTWGYGPMGVLSIVLIVLVIWALAGERPLFRSRAGDNVRDAVQEVGHDVKAAGRETAEAIRRTVE